NRMSVVTPQLPSLVRARTVDLERHLERERRSFAQVLVLGVGFDPKAVRFSSATQRWFGLDLRDMHRERESRFGAADAQARNFVPVIGDLLSDSWYAALQDAGFRPDVPTFVVAEGISMYLPRELLATVFRKLRTLTSSPHSRFWLDHVSSGLFDLDL